MPCISLHFLVGIRTPGTEPLGKTHPPSYQYPCSRKMFVKKPSPVESVEAPYHVVDVVLHVDPTTVVHELGTPQNLCQASAMFKTRMLHSMKSLIGS